MFRDEFLAWVYDQLSATGVYDVARLRYFSRIPAPDAAIVALGLFNALPDIEKTDILRRYAALGCNRQEAAE
jgi:hypothetical protein